MGHVQGTPPLRRRPRSPTMVSYCCGKRPTMLSWIMAAFAASCTSSSVASGLPYLHQPLTCCKDVQPAIKACSCRQSAVKASTRLPWCTVPGKGLGLHQACMHLSSGLNVTAACAAAVCRTGHAGWRPPDVVQDGVVEQNGVLRNKAHMRAQRGLHNYIQIQPCLTRIAQLQILDLKILGCQARSALPSVCLGHCMLDC